MCTFQESGDEKVEESGKAQTTTAGLKLHCISVCLFLRKILTLAQADLKLFIYGLQPLERWDYGSELHFLHVHLRKVSHIPDCP